MSIFSRRMIRSRNVNAPLPGTGERPLGTAATVYQHESTGRYDQEQLILGLNSRMSLFLTLARANNPFTATTLPKASPVAIRE